jgi:hypothetical protein
MTEHDVLSDFAFAGSRWPRSWANVSAGVARWAWIARRTTARRSASIGGGLRRSTCASVAGPGSLTRSGRISSSGSSPSLGHPGYGPRRTSAELAREKWDGMTLSEHGVWRVLCRVGLNTRAKRMAPIARHRDADERKPDRPPPRWHIDASGPGQKVEFDCFRSGGCRHEGHGLPVDRHRRPLHLRLGRAAQLRAHGQIRASSQRR